MKNPASVLIAVAATFLMVGSGEAAVTFCNNSLKELKVAFGAGSGSDSDPFRSVGWWHIGPGSCLDFSDRTPNDFYYAVRPADGVNWEGDENTTARRFCTRESGDFYFKPGSASVFNGQVVKAGYCPQFDSSDPPRAKNFRPIAGRTKVDLINSSEGYITSEAYCFNLTSQGSFLAKSLQELVASKEAEAIGTAICSYYSGQPAACVKTTKEGTKLVNRLTRSAGSDHEGEISARPGYEVCKAHWDTNDWSVTERTTFHTEIRPSSSGATLYYLVSLPVGRSVRDWVDTKLIIDQVPIGQREKFGCWPIGSVPWHCKGNTCSNEMPGARTALPVDAGNRVCISHNK